MDERAILAGLPGAPGSWNLEEDMEELAELARSSGALPVAQVVQHQRRRDPATLFTSGKAQEVADAVRAQDATLVLTNQGLSPRQQMRMEDLVGCRVVDRTRLILDIFARRARSHQGRIQVELAQLLYLLPRLTGLGRELSRTGGGIGTRGPGETQLETDRRRVRARITSLRRQLEGVASVRQVQREGRRRTGLPVVALVGYTNAGKSSLHRALAGPGSHVADQLFATLDPTVRGLDLPGNRRALLVDTVGFVHDLPPALVQAFSATLEEVVDADLLVEVLDQSHARCWEQREAVEKVLAELGAGALPRIVVWNKADLPAAEGAGMGGASRDAEGHSVPELRLSALTGQGLEDLRALLAQTLPSGRRRVRVLLPFAAEGLVAAVRSQGEMLTLRYGDEGIALEAECPAELAGRLEQAGRSWGPEAPAGKQG